MVEENEVSDDLDSAPDPLDSWSDGAAFGAAEDTDEICDIPVEEWIKDIKMESTQEGASTDNTNITTATNEQQTTPETKTDILCQTTKSVSTIHQSSTNNNTSINTKQPAARLHFRELEAQLKAERAAQQTDAIAAQQSFEKGPKMIPIEMIAPIQHSNSDEEDSLDDAKNYRLPIGIRKMNEKARKFYICVLCACTILCVSSMFFDIQLKYTYL